MLSFQVKFSDRLTEMDGRTDNSKTICPLSFNVCVGGVLFHKKTRPPHVGANTQLHVLDFQ